MLNLNRSLGILALSVFMTFSACQKEDAIMPGDTTEFAASEFQVVSLDGLEDPEVTPATESDEFKIRDTDRTRENNHGLPFILRQLHLDEAQRTAVKGFVEQQATCIAEHRAIVQERHQEHVKRANILREDLVKAYRAGRITKADLEERLTTLRERLKENLRGDEQKQVRMRIMHKCRAELMANIRSVLNREQLQKWHRWQQSQQ